MSNAAESFNKLHTEDPRYFSDEDQEIKKQQDKELEEKIRFRVVELGKQSDFSANFNGLHLKNDDGKWNPDALDTLERLRDVMPDEYNRLAKQAREECLKEMAEEKIEVGV